MNLLTLPHKAPSKSLFVSGNELLSGDIKMSYLIDGIIETDTTGQMFGPSGAGKTFVALDMALCIATGEPWNNRDVIQGLAIYFCAEGRTGISRRIKAWCNVHSKCNDDLSLIQISKNTIDFSPNNEELIIEELQKISKEKEIHISLVVIDTLARHMPCGADENSTKDMNIIIHVVDSIRESLANCVIMFVHHSGHNTPERARGASALKAALDFEICCKPGALKFTKMKDAVTPEPIGFKLKSVTIGEDNDGEELCSAIVEYETALTKSLISQLTGIKKIGIDLLIETCVIIQKQINGKWSGYENEWRNRFYEYNKSININIKQDTLKQSYNRMKSFLLKEKLISIQNEIVIVLSEEHQNNINDLINKSQTVHGT